MERREWEERGLETPVVCQRFGVAKNERNEYLCANRASQQGEREREEEIIHLNRCQSDDVDEEEDVLVRLRGRSSVCDAL